MMEKRLRRGDNSFVWTETTYSCVRGEGGEVAYFIAVVEDIPNASSPRTDSAR